MALLLNATPTTNVDTDCEVSCSPSRLIADLILLCSSDILLAYFRILLPQLGVFLVYFGRIYVYFMEARHSELQ